MTGYWSHVRLSSCLIWTRMRWVKHPEEAEVLLSRSCSSSSTVSLSLRCAGYQFVHRVGAAGVWCGEMGVHPQWSPRSSLISCGNSEPLLGCPLWMWAAVCVCVARKLRFSHVCVCVFNLSDWDGNQKHDDSCKCIFHSQRLRTEQEDKVKDQHKQLYCWYLLLIYNQQANVEHVIDFFSPSVLCNSFHYKIRITGVPACFCLISVRWQFIITACRLHDVCPNRHFPPATT